MKKQTSYTRLDLFKDTSVRDSRRNPALSVRYHSVVIYLCVVFAKMDYDKHLSVSIQQVLELARNGHPGNATDELAEVPCSIVVARAKLKRHED